MDEVKTVSLRADLARKLLEMKYYEEDVGNYVTEIKEAIENIIELNLAFANRTFEELDEEEDRAETPFIERRE